MFCTPFWVCSVGLFVTFVPRTMACMCSVYGLLHLGVVHCFSCVLLTFCHASVSRTVWYESSWQFLWLVSFALFRMFFVDSVTLVPCALSFMCCVWLFGTLVPRALVWMCSVRLFVGFVFCALFSVYFVGLFVTLLPRTFFCMCSVWFYVTLVPCTMFCMCSFWSR